MSNMNELGFPMWDHRRVDGSYLQTVGFIDFMSSDQNETQPTIIVDNKEQPLLPGTIFGGFIRYRWRQKEWKNWHGRRLVSDRSTRLHVQGYYTGQITQSELDIPGFKTEQPVALPVVDVKLWLWTPPYKLDVGQIALGRLCEGERAAIEDISLDHQTIMRKRDIDPLTSNPRPYLGAVQYGGLYVVPPLNIS